MTALEIAEKMIDDIARGVRSGEWTQIRPLAITSLASAFDAVKEAAYSKGVEDTIRLFTNPNNPKED